MHTTPSPAALPQPPGDRSAARPPAAFPLMVVLAATLLAAPTSTDAQSIDLGRGELPVRVPADYSIETPTPLIVLLHGYGSSGARQESYMKFGDLVDSHGFLLVAPDGTEQATGRNPRFWNASKACCNFAGSTVDDSGYVLAVIDETKRLFTVDADRVYLVGHSNGGFMSFRVAREHPDVIAAIVSLAGAASSEERGAPSAPVHVLQIHGTVDETILFDGGDIGDVAYPGARESVERWARYNGCSSEPSRRENALDLDVSVEGPETGVVRYASGCLDGGSAELWTIVEGGHSPRLSPTFTEHVVEWLLAHPKR